MEGGWCSFGKTAWRLILNPHQSIILMPRSIKIQMILSALQVSTVNPKLIKGKNLGIY